jgi:CheY-like chemotaxis protein
MGNILVVEDDPSIMALLDLSLRTAGPRMAAAAVTTGPAAGLTPRLPPVAATA